MLGLSAGHGKDSGNSDEEEQRSRSKIREWKKQYVMMVFLRVVDSQNNSSNHT